MGALLFSGCASPYASDRGALVGGLTGAGVGTLIGSGGGHPVAGSLIGGGVGTLTGAVIGDSIDKADARRHAEMQASMVRAVPAGVVTVDDVIAMTRAGVNSEVICNHIRTQGAIAPQSHDLIRMQQAGVDPSVMQAMQSDPPATAVVHGPLPPPVIVEEHYYPYSPPPPWWHRSRFRRPRPGVSFEFYSGR